VPLPPLPALTPVNFRDAVLSTLHEYEGRYGEPLETYLRSLWGLVRQAKDEEPAFALFAKLIHDAFQACPVEFAHQWLKFEAEPDWLPDEEGYLIRSWTDVGAVVIARAVPAFEILERTMLFQIADLNRMPEQIQTDPLRYFGRDSPTGTPWANFDVFTYWECATAGFIAKLEVPLHQWRFQRCDWATLALLLSLGRSYE
jgi:hypothetical protein